MEENTTTTHMCLDTLDELDRIKFILISEKVENARLRVELAKKELQLQEIALNNIKNDHDKFIDKLCDIYTMNKSDKINITTGQIIRG
jgi:hypothetical protein